jgi:hypothetical protein
LNHDYKHGSTTLLEFDMSQAQWGAFVSSFGNGSGVPATLSFFNGRVPQAPAESRLALSHKEVRDAGTKVVAEVREDFEALQKAINDKMGMKEIRSRMHTLECRINNTPANMEFAAKSLTKHSENVVTKARSDIEGMILMAQRQGQGELVEGMEQPVIELQTGYHQVDTEPWATGI